MEEGERGKQQLLNINPQLNTSQLGSVLFLLRLFHKRLNGLLIDTQKTARLYLARTNFWIHSRENRFCLFYATLHFKLWQYVPERRTRARLQSFTSWCFHRSEMTSWRGGAQESACWMYETGSLCERGSCYNPRSKAFKHMRAGRTWQRGKVSNFIFVFHSRMRDATVWCEPAAPCELEGIERESQNRDTITNSFSQS